MIPSKNQTDTAKINIIVTTLIPKLIPNTYKITQ